MIAGGDLRARLDNGSAVLRIDALYAARDGEDVVAARRAWLHGNPEGEPLTWYVPDERGDVIAASLVVPRRFAAKGHERAGVFPPDDFVASDCDGTLYDDLDTAREREIGPEGVQLTLAFVADSDAPVTVSLPYFVREIGSGDPVLRLRSAAQGRGATLTRVTEVTGAFDDLWERARHSHGALGTRDAAYVRWRYKSGSESAELYQWEDGGRIRGWVVLLRHEDGEVELFDALVERPSDARRLVAGAVTAARALGDAVSMHAHWNARSAYGRALTRCGFRTEPGPAVGFRGDLEGFPEEPAHWHLTRADLDPWQRTVLYESIPDESPPRRVLYLMDIYMDRYGGTEGQVATLIENLPSMWRPELWVLQASAYLRAGGIDCPTRELSLPPAWSPAFYPRLRAVASTIRAEGFALIHAFHHDTCTVAPLLGALAGVPVITSRRDLGYWQTERKLDALRRANRLADLILANADAVAQRTIHEEWVPPARVLTIPNGHPTERFLVAPSKTFRQDIGVDDDARLMCLVANFRPLKRQVDMVEALAQLGKKLADVHVVFIGEYDASETVARAAELGVSERVHVYPMCADVVPALKHCELGVLCSESEGLSNAIIEYMGCGLPVVATNVGGNPELVVDDENGWVYEPGNVAQLANLITRIMGNKRVRARMGRASSKRFAANHRLEDMVNAHVDVYETIVAERAGESGAGLTCSVLTRVSDLEALRDEWDALLEPSQFFLSPLWVLTWLRWSGARPCVPVARDGSGRLVGLLPLAWTGRTLEFCGQVLGADHLDVVASPGRGPESAAALLRALDGLAWKRLDLKHVSEDGPLRLALHDARGSVRFGERFSTRCYYVEAPDGWDAYLEAHFTSKPRTRLRRGVENFLAREGAQVQRITKPEECLGAMARLFALHESRAHAAGRRSTFSGKARRVFHETLAKTMAETGRMHCVFLTVGGKDIAVDYGFVWHGKVYGFQSGMIPDAETENPGTVLGTIVLQEDTFGAGKREYDFLDGDEAYKARWATGERRLYDVTVHPRTKWGRLKSVGAGVFALMKSAVKRKLKR